MSNNDDPTPAEHSEATGGVALARTLKIAGETVTPGASLIIDGKFGIGVMHVLGAGLARALLGPAGVAVLGMNSYVKSTSGKHLHEHVLGG